jgi:hypothetical protein
MSLPRISPYAPLAGALWGDLVSADTMIECAALALEFNNPKLAADYIRRAKLASAKGLARNVAQYEQAEQAA